MANKRRDIFVLWGKHFDEAAATLFITELRKSGLRVKVVGLDGRQTPGAHGLILVPDVTLSEAQELNDRVACIILPCRPALWNRVLDDPRVEEFLHNAQNSGIQIITKDYSKEYSASVDATSQQSFNKKYLARRATIFIDSTIVYPNNDQLLAFVNQLAKGIATGEVTNQALLDIQEWPSAIV